MVASCSAARRHSIDSNAEAPGTLAHAAPGSEVVLVGGATDDEVVVGPGMLAGADEVVDVVPWAIDVDDAVVTLVVVGGSVVLASPVVVVVVVAVCAVVELELVEVVVVVALVPTAKSATAPEDRAVV